MMAKENSIKILYVEDDATIAFLTKDNLMIRGFDVTHVSDGIQALEKISNKTFHICLLDVMLPKMDGFSLAKEIRKKNISIPILFISARSLIEDKIKGLSIGADDYITKPFSIDELVLRIEVFLKRSIVTSQGESSETSLGNSFFNYENQYIVINDVRKDLTQRENELLHFFLVNNQKILKRDEILKTIWGDDDYFLGRSLDVFISRLRKIISADPNLRIENIHGVGFRFISDN